MKKTACISWLQAIGSKFRIPWRRVAKDSRVRGWPGWIEVGRAVGWGVAAAISESGYQRAWTKKITSRR